MSTQPTEFTFELNRTKRIKIGEIEFEIHGATDDGQVHVFLSGINVTKKSGNKQIVPLKEKFLTRLFLPHFANKDEESFYYFEDSGYTKMAVGQEFYSISLNDTKNLYNSQYSADERNAIIDDVDDNGVNPKPSGIPPDDEGSSGNILIPTEGTGKITHSIGQFQGVDKSYRAYRVPIPLKDSIYSAYGGLILLFSAVLLGVVAFIKFSEETDDDVKEYFKLKRAERKIKEQKTKARLKQRISEGKLEIQKQKTEKRIKTSEFEENEATQIEDLLKKREKKILSKPTRSDRAKTSKELLNEIEEKQRVSKIISGDQSIGEGGVQIGEMTLGSSSGKVAEEGIKQVGGIGKQIVSSGGRIIEKAIPDVGRVGGTVIKGTTDIIKEGVGQTGKIIQTGVKGELLQSGIKGVTDITKETTKLGVEGFKELRKERERKEKEKIEKEKFDKKLKIEKEKLDIQRERFLKPKNAENFRRKWKQRMEPTIKQVKLPTGEIVQQQLPVIGSEILSTREITEDEIIKEDEEEGKKLEQEFMKKDVIVKDPSLTIPRKLLVKKFIRKKIRDASRTKDKFQKLIQKLFKSEKLIKFKNIFTKKKKGEDLEPEEVRLLKETEDELEDFNFEQAEETTDIIEIPEKDIVETYYEFEKSDADFKNKLSQEELISTDEDKQEKWINMTEKLESDNPWFEKFDNVDKGDSNAIEKLLWYSKSNSRYVDPQLSFNIPKNLKTIHINTNFPAANPYVTMFNGSKIEFDSRLNKNAESIIDDIINMGKLTELKSDAVDKIIAKYIIQNPLSNKIISNMNNPKIEKFYQINPETNRAMNLSSKLRLLSVQAKSKLFSQIKNLNNFDEQKETLMKIYFPNIDVKKKKIIYEKKKL